MPKLSWKAARVNAEMTISQAAEAVDVSPSTIKSWEAGRTFPKLPQAMKMCEVYGVPYDCINFNPKKF